MKVDEGLRRLSEHVGKELASQTSNIIYAEKFGVSGASDPTARLQAAIDEAIARQEAVRIVLPRYVTIDGTINVNSRENRYPLYFEGGSLHRTNPTGFMFDADIHNDNSDIFFTGTQFKSSPGSGAKIFNGDKIIRLQTRGCSFRGVDTVLRSAHYAQSYRSIGDIVAGGGVGYAFDLDACYDTVFDNLLLEHRESGLRVRTGIRDLKMRSSCLEGLTGTAIQLGDDEAAGESQLVLLEGIYFEANRVANIRFGTALNRIGPASVKHCLMLGNGAPTFAESIVDAGGRGVGGLFVERNFSLKGTCVDVSRAAGGPIYSRWNRNKDGYAYPVNPYLFVDGNKIQSTTGGVTISRFGDFTRLYRGASQSIPANSTQQVTIDFGTPIYKDDVISPQLLLESGASLSVNHYVRSGHTVHLYVTNKSSGAVTADLAVTVLKFPYSVSG
ncbi:hypothetical protein J2W27_003959 [Variovorax boronicumulans]|uniref:hypothetical protein n=1 Tax=Variovorax boronicumulans TaxID=436515 RepID=UPI0027826474|nr:hypothetical protein [Variovorax boronicumulans]MDP9911835.1 hypothetical protein [Variovorax boronicumulans]